MPTIRAELAPADLAHPAQATRALHAELVVIDNALRVHEVGTRMLLLVDSTKVIHADRALIARPKKCVEKGGKVKARLYSISNAFAYRDVDLRWVRGHTDHALDDAADRLARLGRQAHMYDTDTRTANGIARQIASGAAARFALAHERAAIPRSPGTEGDRRPQLWGLTEPPASARMRSLITMTTGGTP